MPKKTQTVYAPAELFLEHQGIRLYHTYVNDNVTQGILDYRFVLDESHNLNRSFMVQDLPNWRPDPHQPPAQSEVPLCEREMVAMRWQEYWAEKREWDHVKVILQEAIDQGHLKIPATCEATP
jgi:hypothetical protein